MLTYHGSSYDRDVRPALTHISRNQSETVAPVSTGCRRTQSPQDAEEFNGNARSVRARLHRLRKNSQGRGFVSGHEFTRADKARQMSAGFSPCRTDYGDNASFNEFFRNLFSRADRAFNSIGALAPEGCFSGISPSIMSFSASCPGRPYEGSQHQGPLRMIFVRWGGKSSGEITAPGAEPQERS